MTSSIITSKDLESTHNASEVLKAIENLGTISSYLLSPS